MNETEEKSEIRYLDAVLSLHLITDQQYVSTYQYWKQSGGSMLNLLIQLGLITPAQSATIELLFEQDVVFQAAKFKGLEQEKEESDNVSGDGFDEDSLFETPESVSTRATHKKAARKPIPRSKPWELNDEMFGQYSFVDFIGKGGLGQVTQCCDRSINRNVALKEIRADLHGKDYKRLIMRFLLEARVTGQLQHPGIVPVYEMGIKPDGALYYTMKHVKGRPFDKVLSEIGKSSKTEAQKYAERFHYLHNLLEVCLAMGYAHEKGIIHRDLKPANIILGKHGETIILDWGLAKVLEQPDINMSMTGSNGQEQTEMDTQFISMKQSSLNVSGTGDSARQFDITMEGEMIGTPSYMAPEQIDPAFGPIDKQSDVYALGLIFYRILTGNSPYRSNNVRDLLREISDSTIENPFPVVNGVEIPADLAAICFKALNKEKSQRFPSANELAQELGAFLEGRLVSFYTYTTKEYLKRFIRRNKLAATFILVSLITLFAGFFISLHYGYQASIERTEAQKEATRALNAEQKALESQNEAVKANKVTKMTVSILPKFSDRILNKARDINENVTSFLLRMKDDLQEATTWPEWDTKTLERGAFIPKIEAMMRDKNHWLSIVVTDSSGTIKAIAPQTMRSSLGVTLANQHHIKEAIKTKQPICSRLFENAEKNFIGMSIVMPVLRNDELVGLIIGVFNPNDVLENLINIKTLGNVLLGMCIDQVGYVLLDETFPDKVFQNLYADPFYESNPDFHATCMRLFSQPFGIGHYMWHTLHSKKDINHIIAWYIVNMEDLGLGKEEQWAIVLSGSFPNGQAQLMTREEWRELQNEDRKLMEKKTP